MILLLRQAFKAPENCFCIYLLHGVLVIYAWDTGKAEIHNNMKDYLSSKVLPGSVFSYKSEDGYRFRGTDNFIRQQKNFSLQKWIQVKDLILLPIAWEGW